jgi:geranylgeranylglycerol-phosphate geranylgeranyltransferase
MLLRLGGYLGLMRIPNGLIAVASILVASVSATRSFAPGRPILLGAAAAFLILAGGNALNDYFDRGIDAVNKPGRPIPSGRVPRNGALTFAAVLFGGGLATSLFLPAGALALAVLNTGLLIVYARYSKRMLVFANLLVAWMTGSVFLFAGAILRRAGLPIVVLAASAFFIMMTREILKDIEDLEGDRRAGASTIPIRWGIKRARTVSSLFALPAVLVLVPPYAAGDMGGRYLGMVLLAAAALAASLFLPPGKAQKVVKGATLIVLLAFVAGSL